MEHRFTVVRVDESCSDEPMLEELQALISIGAQLKKINCNNEDEIIDACHDADVITTNLLTIGRKVFYSLPRLKAVLRRGIGFDSVDIEAATENGVLVINIPDFCAEEISNHVLAMLLSSARKLTTLNAFVHKGEWDLAKEMQAPMASIYNETLGIIGCGRAGLAVARKALPFGFRILGYDKYVSNDLLISNQIQPVSLDELLKRSDYITIHTGISPETYHMIGKEQFDMMKPNATLINTSRGSNIDQNALTEALQQKRIACACLDVFEDEPITKDSPLLMLDNVIMTPHAASYSDASFQLLRKKAAEEYLRLAQGKLPLHLCNPQVQANMKSLI